MTICLLNVQSGKGQEVIGIDSVTQSKAYDLANISTETQTTSIILEPLFENDFDKKDLARVDSTVSAEYDIIKIDFEKVKNHDLSNVSKASLDALQSTWSLYQSEIEKGLEFVRGLFSSTNEDLELLKKQKVRWKATLLVLEASESPEEMVSGIQALFDKIEVAESRLNENLSNLILMETKINELDQMVNKVDIAIQKALEERSKDVFRQNAPVFWKLLFTPIDSSGMDTTALDSMELVLSKTDTMDLSSRYIVHWSKEKIKFSTDFVDSNQNTIYFHLLLWVLTLMLSYKFGKVQFDFPSTEELSFAQESFLLIKHQLFVSATYVSILYSALLYDFLPSLILEILIVILIMMNVVIHLNNKVKGVWKISVLLSLLYISGQLSAEVWFDPFGYRVYLFAKMGMIYWVIRLFTHYLESNKNEKSPTIWRELHRLHGFIRLVLIISFISNLFGFVKLSEVTALLVTQIIVVSYIFYGILVTSNGLVSLIFTVAWTPKGKGSAAFRASIESFVLKVVNFLASLFWVKAVLSTVGIYNPIMDSILEVFSTPAEIGSVSISIQDIVYGLIVFVITYGITKFIGIVINEGGLDRFKLKRGVPNAISLVVRYSLFGLGFMLALSVAGIDLSSFSLMAGALGIGIGFGLQNIISNFVSGLILVFERPLQEGDVVEVNSLLGIVKNIGVRSSNIRTYTGSEVVVPNEALISKELINWTLSDPHKRMEISIGVDYGSEPREIIKLLTEAALGNSDVKRDPGPIALFEEFGDSSLNFRLLFWVHHSIALGVRSDVMLRVSDTMREHNINIPFPIRTVMMDKGAEKEISTELLPDQRSNEDIDASSKANK